MDKSGLPPLKPYLNCEKPGEKKGWKILERDSGVPTVVASTITGFITARTALEISTETNERLARKMDAAKFLDEAKLGLWDNRVAPPSFKLLKRSYDNQAFHFKDEEK